MILVRFLELLAAFLLLAAMYWSPTMIAFGRRAWNWPAIAVVNALLGWTLIGWLIALAWAAIGAPAGATTASLEVPRKPRFSWTMPAWLAHPTHLVRG